MQISNSSLSAVSFFIPNSAGGQLEATAPVPAPKITANTALFLDFDGTLVDIAAQPELVKIPQDLVNLLAQLFQRLNGALAIVSGRSLSDLDAYLAPLKLTTAAEHGAVYRLAGEQPSATTSPALQHIISVVLALAAQHDGLRAEIKSHAVALHYRHAPELKSMCLATMTQAVKHSPGLELLHGKFVFDIKSADSSKGTAIQRLMNRPPFRGRRPLFAGDDTTDEAGFSLVQSIGGDSVKIGTGSSLARYRCPDPLTFRQWLANHTERPLA